MMTATRLDPAARRRLESCLTLARLGATPGERAAGKAAAERIAAAAGLTLPEAQGSGASAKPTPTWPHWSPPPGWKPPPGWPGQRRPRAKPRKPPTVADRLREKAEEEADRRRRTAAADRRLMKELEEQAVWETQAREEQAERDRVWTAQQSRPV